jgi:hypothetical protein
LILTIRSSLTYQVSYLLLLLALKVRGVGLPTHFASLLLMKLSSLVELS